MIEYPSLVKLNEIISKENNKKIKINRQEKVQDQEKNSKKNNEAGKQMYEDDEKSINSSDLSSSSINENNDNINNNNDNNTNLNNGK